MSNENFSYLEPEMQKSEDVISPEMEHIITKVGALRAETSELLFHDPSYSAFTAMRSMSLGTYEVLRNVEAICGDDTSKEAIFVFGSPSRIEMLPNSDLDLGIIGNTAILDTQEGKNTLREGIESLPFEQVEIANWSSPKSMLLYSKISLVEGNQAIDARYVAGNTDSLHEYFELGVDRNTNSLERKLTNFFWEKNFLHTFDYPKKYGSFGANLKYERGASRDLIFIDWYMQILKELGDSITIDPEMPQLEQALGHLPLDFDPGETANAIDLISVIKTMGATLHGLTSDRRFLGNNQDLFDMCFLKYSDKLSRFGCKNGNELGVIYNNARKLISSLIDRLEEKVQSRLRINSGREWSDSYDYSKSDIADNNEYGVRINLFNQTEDRIIRNASLWKLVEYANTPSLALDLISHSIERDNVLWEDIGTILTNQFLDDSSLRKVAKKLVNRPGYEYLLRLIFKHPNAGPETLALVRESPLLDGKYKVKK